MGNGKTMKAVQVRETGGPFEVVERDGAGQAGRIGGWLLVCGTVVSSPA